MVQKYSTILSALAIALTLAGPNALADLAATGGNRVPAIKWFELRAEDRTTIVSSIAAASNANFLDVFSCITLFARDTTHSDSTLENLIWLCSPPGHR